MNCTAGRIISAYAEEKSETLLLRDSAITCVNSSQIIIAINASFFAVWNRKKA
jgi:hypothetical protein